MKLRYILSAVLLLAIVAALVYSRLKPDVVLEVTHPRVQAIRAYVDEQAVTQLPRDYLISMPIAGWLEPITLREGDPVKKDQVVARLEVEDLTDRVRQVEHQITDLEIKINKTKDNRLENNAMVQSVATVKSFDDTVKAAEAKANASQAVAEFARSEVERLRRLTAAQAAADREMRSAETDARRAEAEHQSDLLQLSALKTLAAVTYIFPKAVSDYIDRKSFDRESYEQQLAEQHKQLEIEKRNLARAEIKSPIDGVVQSLRYHTIGAVAQPGEPLMEIVPTQDKLVVEAKLSPTDVGQVKVGQPTVVKISTYDFSQYGALEGLVTYIAADSQTDPQSGSTYFRVVAETDRTYLGGRPGELPITPGMQATLDIHTGERSVLEFLLRPVKTVGSEAFRER